MHKQDWTRVDIGNPSKKQTKPKISQNPTVSRFQKIEEENETFHHKYIDRELSNKIVMARSAKKLSRNDLAVKCSCKVADLALIENGKTLKNDPAITKVRRFLKI